jgi:multicomponent Na+:H+ antiporter subunit C
VSGAALYAFLSAPVAALGLYGLLAQEDVLRRIVSANVLGAGVFLLLVALARRAGEDGPDPVPHAMVLTGIVVAVSFTGFAVVLAGRVDEIEEEEDEGAEAEVPAEDAER